MLTNVDADFCRGFIAFLRYAKNMLARMAVLSVTVRRTTTNPC